MSNKSSFDEKLETARREGFETAMANGTEFEDCPYVHHTPLYESWLSGFLSAFDFPVKNASIKKSCGKCHSCSC